MAKCLDACEEIIKSGKFSLAGNQKDVFKADNEDCTEAVLLFLLIKVTPVD